MFVRVLGGIGGSALQLKPYRAARSNPVNRRYDRVAYCAVPSASPGEREGELKMDKEKETRSHAEHQLSQLSWCLVVFPDFCSRFSDNLFFALSIFFYNIRDVMTDSFGEGYSTRSDEDGFGCIYSRDNDTVNHPGVILDLWFLSVLLTKIEYIYFEHFL